MRYFDGISTSKHIKRSFNITILHGDGILPVKGYDSVNLPSGLYATVKNVIKTRPDLGYRSVTEFVAESVRKRVEELEKVTSYTPSIEKNVPPLQKE